MTRIYLDNNATTRPAPEVVSAMATAMADGWGNPSSAHAFGATAGRLVATAREAVRALIGAARAADIVFTSGGSEANATAIASALAASGARDEVLTTPTEHASVLRPLRDLAGAGRIRLVELPVDGDGLLAPQTLAARLSPRTALLALQWANSETGVVQPIAELAALARAVGAHVHCDGVQAAGRLPLDVAGLAVDTLALSAHKLHGPKGAGALYLRGGLALTPLIAGGGQERGRRAGTENVPGIVGLGTAADLARTRRATDGPAIAALRDRLEAGLAAALPGLRINGAGAPRLANTSNIALPDVDGDDLALLLDRAGVAVSTGSACRAGARGASPVLRAMGVPASHIGGALRLSLSRETTTAEIDAAIERIVERAGHLRSAGRSAA